MNVPQEVEMDHGLGEILAEESPCAHDFAKHEGLRTNVHIVVDAERVKDSCKQHVFSDEGDMTVSLGVGHRVSLGGSNSQQRHQHGERVDGEETDETGDWDHEVPHFALVNQ